MFAVMCVRFFGDDSVAECIQQKTKSVIKTSEEKKTFSTVFFFQFVLFEPFFAFSRSYMHSFSYAK